MFDSCNVLMLVIMAVVIWLRQPSHEIFYMPEKRTLNMNPVLNKLKLCQLVICLMSYLLIHIFWVFELAASSDL